MADPIFQQYTSDRQAAESGASATMVDPSGALVTVPLSELGTAREAGYSLATGEEQAAQSIGQDVKDLGADPLVAGGAFGAGALRTMSAGLSDLAIAQAATGNFQEGAAGLAGIGEVAPGATLAGEITGAINPYNPVGALGNTITRGAQGYGLLARAGVNAAVGAGEGAVYGGGSALSKSVMEGGPLTFERVASEMGPGMIWGGLGGAVTPFAAAGLGKLGKALTPQGDDAARFARERAMKAIGARGSDLRRLRDKGVDDVGELLLRYEFAGGKSAGQKLMQALRSTDDLQGGVQQMTRELGEQLESVAAKVDDVSRQSPDLGPDMASWLRRVDEEIVGPSLSSTSAATRSRAGSVMRELAPLREIVEGGGTLSFQEARAARQALRESFQPPTPTGGGLPAAPPEHAKLLESAERMLAEELDTSAERALRSIGEDGAAWKTATKDISSAIKAQKIINKADLQNTGNRFISPTDYMSGMGMGMGMLASGNVAGIGYGVATALGHKFLRERGSSTMAVLADAMSSRSGRIDAAARKLAGLAKRAPSARRGATAYGIFADDTTVEDVEPAKIESSPTMAAHDPERTRETIDRVQQLQLMDAQQRIRVLSEQPGIQALAEESPQLAQGVMAQAIRQQDALAARLPEQMSRQSRTLQPGREPVHMSPVEQRRFARFARGVEDPAGVIDDMASGELDREALEGLKAAHPNEYQEVRLHVAQLVAENEGLLPTNRRRMLGLAFDLPADASLIPANTDAAQQTWEQLQAQEQQEKSGGKTLDLADMGSKSDEISGEVGV